MECLSKENGSIVQDAEVKRLEVPNSSEILKGLTDKIPKDKLKMAEKLGIPIEELLTWASVVSNELEAIKTNLPNEIKKKMAEAIKEGQQAQLQQIAERQKANPQSQVGGMDIGALKDLGPLLQLIGGGGGASDPYSEIGKTVVNEVIPTIFQEIFKVKIKAFAGAQAQEAPKT